jgi:signal peptidase I
MTKIATRPGPAPKPVEAKKAEAEKKEKPKETWRDLIEQVVVAFLLAILIRGFDVEAFVIPTGSMAPTLKGRHKEIVCEQCKSLFAVNVSEETEAFLTSYPDARKQESGICVNCRYPAAIGDAPSYKGDRILVMKFPYEFPFLPGSGGPARWDVVVFHFPERPEQNYIKRLIGLPGEELRISRGDIFVRPAGTTDPFRIVRKPPSRLQAMAILVNDDRHRARDLKDRPEWLRWQPTGGWREAKPGEFSFTADAKAAAGGLRYRQVVPDPEQWEAVSSNRKLPRPPRSTLITDFYSYNASTFFYSPYVWSFTSIPAYSELSNRVGAWLQTDWVGDLLLEFDLKVDKAEGEVTFELGESGVKNRCVVDLKTGMAGLFHGETKLGEAQTRLNGPGRYAIGFANFDDRLTLWVDGRTPFGEGLGYDDGPTAPRGPTADDLDPVGLSAAGASVTVSGLVLKRDIYYTQDPRKPDFVIPGSQPTYDSRGRAQDLARVVNAFDVLSDPARFGPLMADTEEGASYPIRPDHFMMMGDNSPRSSDSRAWTRQDRDWDPDPEGRSKWEVPRKLLIGKAFFVYWPHGVPFGPDIRISHDFRVPFRPNFERMKPIR